MMWKNYYIKNDIIIFMNFNVLNFTPNFKLIVSLFLTFTTFILIFHE